MAKKSDLHKGNGVFVKVILIFVDGLGIGENDPGINPCVHKDIRHLALFKDGNRCIQNNNGRFLVPTEATLGINGLPQSATGQTTILTGINCSKLLGRHLPGYPNKNLRNVLREFSILKQIRESGFRTAFINTYRPPFFNLTEKRKWHRSTTTVATLSANLDFFNIKDLLKKQSIYHDFTNQVLIDQGYEVPYISAEEAGKNLVRISSHFDFILYEYFLTDRAGHSRQMDKASEVIKQLDRFISSILTEIDLSETLVLITSDHGNIEDLSVKTHTENYVPTILWGNYADIISNRIKTLVDITPSILWLFKKFK
jgi:hypothetical protein